MLNDDEIATMCPFRTRDETGSRKEAIDKETLINDFNIPGLYNIISHCLNHSCSISIIV